MRTNLFLLLSSLLIASVPMGGFRNAHSQQTGVRRCKGERLIKYKSDVAGRGIREPIQLIMIVGVKPDQINREGLMLLAKQLKADFCRESGLYVYIYDDPRAVNKWGWVFSHERRRGQAQMGPLRGTYEFVRETGEEKITFSTKRENPINEMTIIIGGQN